VLCLFENLFSLIPFPFIYHLLSLLDTYLFPLILFFLPPI
jgi:hypothetical protein